MPSSAPGNSELGLRIRVAPEAVTIVSWPLRDAPLRSWAAIALAAGVGALVGRYSPSAIYGWIAFVAMCITLWRVWLSVTFELNSNGVKQTVMWRSRRIPWTAIPQYEVCREGVLLLPDAVVNGLSPLRGLYLPWGAHRQEVLAHLEYYLSTWPAPPRSAAHRPGSGRHPTPH